MSQFSNLLNLLASTSPESEAAGIETIMRKLGVGLREAQAIKNAAKARKATDLSEENLRALQKVVDFKKNPGKLEKIGSGADTNVYDLGDEVLKVSKGANMPLLTQAIAPEVLGKFGVPTKNIEAGKRLYQIQNKVNTPKLRFSDDPEWAALRDARNNLEEKMYRFAVSQVDNPKVINTINDIKHYASPEQIKQLDELEQAMEARRIQFFVEQNPGFEPTAIAKDAEKLGKINNPRFLDPEAIAEDPTMFRAGLIGEEASRLAKPNVKVLDVHDANIGFDAAGNPKIFDTSRFMDPSTQGLSPEQVKRIKESVIAPPETKQMFNEFFTPERTKKVAAALPMSAAIPSKEDNEISYKQQALEMLASGLSNPNVQSGLELMTIPGALVRTTANELTKGNIPSGEQLKKAALFPLSEEQQKLSTETAERSFPDEDAVGRRTALKTLLEFM